MCICVFLSTFFIQSHFTICDWPAFLSLISRHWLQTIHDPQQLYTMCLQSPAIYLSIVFYGFECKLIRLSDIPVRNFEQLIVVWIHWLQPTIDRSIAWLNQLQCFWKRAISEMATKKNHRNEIIIAWEKILEQTIWNRFQSDLSSIWFWF